VRVRLPTFSAGSERVPAVALDSASELADSTASAICAELTGASESEVDESGISRNLCTRGNPMADPAGRPAAVILVAVVAVRRPNAAVEEMPVVLM
jgi:hypothetical protein